MSTSPRLAPARTSSHGKEIGPFPYATVAQPDVRAPQTNARDGARSANAPATESEAQVAQALARGQREGFTEAQKEFEEQLARERVSVASALAQFTRDRALFFQKVEGEAVQLALSIARKILHREAQLDPLLLAAIVRVALEKIDGATGVVLRVPPGNAADWSRSLALQLDPAEMPEIVEDPSQTPDTCVLETAMGTAVLGLEVQLKEIERGLMDLLAARPGVAS